MMKQNIEQIKQVFADLGIDWVEPYLTTEGAINRKETGNHTGLYYIYPEVNFYFGKAGKSGTIYNRHKTHRPKLDVDLRTLYGVERIKSQPQWIYPIGWKEGVRKYIIEDNGDIPEHAVKVGPKQYGPGVLDFPVTHKVDIDTLPVLLWNLDHLTYEQISNIEELVIERLEPYCNDETYQKRLKEKNVSSNR
jgi:hypothetical protein